MRRTDERSPLGNGRIAVSALLALSGLAYLAYKAEYLGLEAPDALKGFIVLPGAALLIAAKFVAFPDARRRLGGTLLAFGVVAVLWTMERDGLPRGWAAYGPYPAHDAERVASSFGQPAYRPRLVAMTLLVPIGMALIARGRAVAATLLSLAALTYLLSPSRVLLGMAIGEAEGMPRRYHYY